MKMFLKNHEFHKLLQSENLSTNGVQCVYLVCSIDVSAIQCCLPFAVFQLVPRHAVVRHHCKMVPGVTLVVERGPDVDLTGVGVDGEDIGVISLW